MVKHDAVADIKSCCAQHLMHVRIVTARLSSVSIRFLVGTSETNEKVNGMKESVEFTDIEGVIYLIIDSYCGRFCLKLIMTNNVTGTKSFFILGFPGLAPRYYGPVLALFLIIYLAIVFGNVFILTFVMCQKSLQKPMYLVFCHLALIDLTFDTVTLPKIISKYWFGSSDISFNGCFTQMFFVHYLGSVTSFILLVMALDRFISICLPLRYTALVSKKFISVLCGIAWFTPVSLLVTVIIQALTLTFCKPKLIVQCFFDHISITNQACGDGVQRVRVSALCIALFCLLLPLAFIVFSYISIMVVIMKRSNAAGRRKTLSTCTPQLFITCLFYLPRCFVYVTNTVGFYFSVDVRILLIVLYSLVPPAINPFIYCLKTQDIKQTLIKKS